MRTLLLLSFVALTAACTAPSRENASASTSDVVVAEKDFVADLRAAYEAAGGTHGNASPLTDVADVPFDTLPGKAREAYNYYASSGLMADVGGTIAQVGTFQGQTVYFVAGDVSDTGSEYGFYDAKGNQLALAYSGQGEHAGPGGVDWLE